MEKEKPEFIPYFHSSQGPAEAPEPMKSGLSVQGRLWEGSIHLLWVPGLDYLPVDPLVRTASSSPPLTKAQVGRTLDLGPQPRVRSGLEPPCLAELLLRPSGRTEETVLACASDSKE